MFFASTFIYLWDKQSGPQPELDIKFPVISLANSSTKTLAWPRKDWVPGKNSSALRDHARGAEVFEALYMKISLIGRTNRKQFISPRTRCTDIEILLIHEALCGRRTRVTSAVERVDFSQSSALSFNKYYKIPTCKQIKSKTLQKRHIM